MNKRKLQIFLSSTYEDLIDHRLAAMEAILAAGHIPAAMQQFSPGDETAWEKIQAWIDESDAFILILGGRYGSIEPLSGKSYVQLEYEYAQEKKKPFFSLVVSKEHHAQRIKEYGLKIHETEHPEKYKQFHSMVTERLVRFWHDEKDIKSAIFHKLPEWAQKPDLVGWIRADEVPTAATMNELAQLSQENRELRSRVSSQEERLDGLTFGEMVNLLRENRILDDLLTKIFIQPRPYLFQMDHFDETFAHGFRTKHRHHAGHLFEVLQETISTHPLSLIVDKSFPLDVLVNEAFLDQIDALSALRKKKGSALKQYIRDCISYDQKNTHLFLREERDFWERLFSVRFRDIREEELGIQIRVGFRNLYLENRRNLGMSLMKVLISPGIISYGETKGEYKLTDTGRKFRNRMLIVGNLDSRLKTLWRDDPQESADPPA